MLQTLRAELAGTRGAILVAALCALLAAPAGLVLAAQEAPAAQAAAAPEESVKLSNDQLEALVAPIALYPDPLLAQCLVASTYPLDIVAAQQWLPKNASLKGDALVEAAQNENWDPSVQALVSIPDALKILSENIKWTTELGDAFLAQQSDVMDAVQRLRAKAKDSGKLASSEQQKVETKTEESTTIIEIQPASTEVVYVPTYSPTVIWGVGYYPYPPLYYPPYYGGAWLGFGLGIAIGIGISGGWGWGCGWHGGGNTININNNNNSVNHHNARNNTHRSGNSNWQHTAQQRGGAPYKDRATASKYGGGARGDSPQARQSQAQSRQSQGGFDRGGASAGSVDRGGSGGEYRGSSSSSRAGSRDIPSSSHSSSAFGGSMSGSSARSTSSRGSSSMGGMRGGGGGRGGRR
jgi:hypothetical protein